MSSTITQAAALCQTTAGEIAVNGVWKAKQGDEYIGVCVKVSPKGYGGAIETIVGINNEGEIIDTQIVSMSETSGIGTKIQSDTFLSQFKGKSGSITGTGSAPEKNQIQTISGATKSSKGIFTRRQRRSDCCRTNKRR